MSGDPKHNTEDYLRMYRQMVRIRTFEDNANQLYLSAKMPGLTHMYSGEEEMFALMHAMRVRVLKAPTVDGRRVLGVILFERTMDAQIEAIPVPEFLWRRGMVSFVKIDQGLEKDSGGVQFMKPMPHLENLLSRARLRGVLGTKMRSVIDAHPCSAST